MLKPVFENNYKVLDEVKKEGSGIDPDKLAFIVYEHDLKVFKTNDGV